RTTNSIAARTDEHALGRGIEQRDVRRIVEENDRVERRCHDLAKARLRLPDLAHVPELELAPFALPHQGFFRGDVLLAHVQVDERCDRRAEDLRLELLEKASD